MKKHIRAFTLVEALVTTACVGMLVAIAGGAGALQDAMSDRQDCMRNLKMLGIGLVSYTGDYGGYFPSYPAMNADVQPLPGKDNDLGIFWRKQGGQAIRTGNRQYFAGPSRYRCIAYGSRMEDTPGEEKVPFTRGNLNCAPIGLGYLACYDYIEKPADLFCPSVKELPKQENLGALAMPQDMIQLGGLDPDSIMFGDYSRVPSFWKGQSDRGILSHYDYRNAPTAVDPAMPDRDSFTIPYTRPTTKTTPGGALFKTEKVLAARAIVADSCSRSSSPAEEMGFGEYAHVEGYNVLYGDGHVNWYGDPKKEIATMPWPAGEPVDASQGPDVSYVPAVPANNQAFAIWHLFDMGGGIDLDR